MATAASAVRGGSNVTQCEMILYHLQQYGSITPMTALNRYGCMRLGARIYDLKRQGHDIRTVRQDVENQFGTRVICARYIMTSKDFGRMQNNGTGHQ